MENDLSDRIKILCGDMSVAAFARKVGLNQAALDRYIKKIREPNNHAIVTIAKSCGVSTDWLLGLTTEQATLEVESEWKVRALQAEKKLEQVRKAFRKVASAVDDLEEAL